MKDNSDTMKIAVEVIPFPGVIKTIPGSDVPACCDIHYKN